MKKNYNLKQLKINSQIFLLFYSQERTKNAQFIIISLRSNMFELADYLVGIYKVSDCTDSLTIKNSDKYRLLDKLNEKENQQHNNVNDKMNELPTTTQQIEQVQQQVAGQIPDEILSH